MEDSAFKAILLSVNVLIFIAALTAGIMLSTNISNTVDVSFETLDLNNKDIYEGGDALAIENQTLKQVPAKDVYFEITNGVYKVKINGTEIPQDSAKIYVDFSKTYSKQYDIVSGQVVDVSYTTN